MIVYKKEETEKLMFQENNFKNIKTGDNDYNVCGMPLSIITFD